MARRYGQEELLQLRESPLAVRPDGLPPVEEWMGPLLDASIQKKHATSKEGTSQIELTTTARRQSFFESRHISRSSNSEDIILGPPKTAFASSTRSFGKFSDPDRYNSLKSTDIDSTKSDRFPTRDTKFLKDKDQSERDRDLDKRDLKPHAANGRKIARDDKEDWGTRPRRPFGQEDTNDRRAKRDGDRWDSREFREHRDQLESANERGHRGEQSKFPSRREIQGKGRHDHPSWFRDGDAQEAFDEEDKTPVRNREWRRGVQGQDRDRDWNRTTKHEQDPEWLDSSSKSEQKESHTQEDFQRWKERMKTGGAQQPDELKKKPSLELASVEAKPAETKRIEGEMFSSLEPSYKVDTGFDDFFGTWGGPKPTHDPAAYGNATSGPSTKEIQASKPTKSSRFAGFFNAPTETPPKEAEFTLPQPTRPVSTDADQEGFQRILQLLGGNKSSNPTPQAEEMMRPKASSPQQNQQEFSHVPGTAAPPHHDTVNRQAYMGFQETPREHHEAPHVLEQLLAQKAAPKEPKVSSPDPTLLLRLMQQSKISSSHLGQVPPHGSLQNPGIQGLPDMQPKNQDLPKQKSPLFFDDPAIANMQRPEGNDLRSQLRRRPTGGPPGYFDDMQYQGPSSGNHTPPNPPGLRTQSSGVPQTMGLQRPPGLEQITSPGGWSNTQQMQQGTSSQYIARPGMPNPPSGRSVNFAPIPQMQMPGGIPPPNDRQAFARGPGSGGPANYGPPPGIVSPLGYVNMSHPPPSAFPPMLHTQESMVGLSHGHPGHFGAGGPQQAVAGHQPSSRHLLEMFMAQAQGGGPNDGNMSNRNNPGMMGPPYR